MKHVYLIFASILLLSACNNTPKKAEDKLVSQTKISDSVNIIPPKENDVEVKNWLDDFKNFRETLHLKDLKKLKTYFDFPVSDDGAAIWSLCNLTEAEIQARKSKFKNADLFYEQDLEQYYNRIFNADFVKMLLKIKSDKLYATHYNETTEVTTADHIYKLIAEYNATSKVLSFNLAYANNGTDEEGNRVSEGEYNIIYSFTVIDGKYLKFKRIDIAG
ncbi:hypothetical protein SAMN05421827_107122 [Pedobacter terrae]|uniref:Lipoprotein n=1 Tax=Pedobacter terrae TaxID=405671 RepID=A0A1G7UU93_9SPHI|nr:hypothetical protein [Pedobacter terrae]SDG51067.1 hypothetical protein SAMN05421827_107122 [Pedobacter terrae]